MGLTRLEILLPLVPIRMGTLDNDLVVLCYAYNCAGHGHLFVSQTDSHLRSTDYY